MALSSEVTQEPMSGEEAMDRYLAGKPLTDELRELAETAADEPVERLLQAARAPKSEPKEGELSQEERLLLMNARVDGTWEALDKIAKACMLRMEKSATLVSRKAVTKKPELVIEAWRALEAFENAWAHIGRLVEREIKRGETGR